MPADGAPRLTVLGSAGSHPGPGRACSSYLLEAGGTRLLLDCGNGSMANLLRVCRPADLDAIVVTHRHFDHWADLIGIFVALRWQREPGVVPVYAHESLRSLIPALSDYESFVEHCPFRPIDAGEHITVGPFAVELHAARHSVPALAPRVTVGERVVTYSGDSDASPELVEAARDADLFIADCTWLDADGPYPEGLHMTGRQAGQVAEAAGARRVLVTHVWPEADPAAVAAEVSAVFTGEVLLAEDRQELTL